MGLSLKKLARKAAKGLRRAAPSLLTFVPGGNIALKAASALKTAGVDAKRARLAAEGRLVSALPVAESVSVQKAAKPVPVRRISVTGTAKAFAGAPKKRSAFVVKMEQDRKDKAYLNSLLQGLGRDEVIQLRAEWTRNPQGYTWPEYVAKQLG
jgi:hypothetical protein